MRFCAGCTGNNVHYIISRFSDSCERYYYLTRFCNLSFFFIKIAKILRIAEKLNKQILKLAAKNIRLKKQRRLLLKKFRNLNDCKVHNITELKKDEEQKKINANTVATSESTGTNSFFLLGAANVESNSLLDIFFLSPSF